MDSIEIRHIDTAVLEDVIRESIKRWEKIKGNQWSDYQIETSSVERNEFSTKAVYHCSTDYCVNHPGPMITIYVDYDEVEMTGKIEIEYDSTFSNAAKQKLIDILNDVIGTSNPSTKGKKV
ncbi:MAG: hypothetical protein RTU63_05075 [Candidatus Thorarchaeota archaeon]